MLEWTQKGKYMIVNPNQNSSLILQTSNPRPIAWIVTQNRDKVINIAPYSLFTPLSFEPPTLIVSFRAKVDGTNKDTLNNILETQKCTICMVDASNKEIMHKTAQELPNNISEAKEFNIETKVLLDEYPPIIGSSPIAYFCEFEQKITLRGDNTIPIILRIDRVFIDEKIIKNREPLYIDFNGVGHIVDDRYRV
jgi:flavin reductase (DIM6/NTAB) family NADH-FMN oxidoreductase RutF